MLLPVMNAHEITDQAIDALLDNASGDVEIYVVDNASDVPYSDNDRPKYKNVHIIRNDVNVAGFGALLQVLPVSSNDIILWMHNDVLIHEQGYDTRILAEFANDDKLAIAGFFGAYGVADNGGRIGSMGNMQGKEWGTPQHLHGDVLTGSYPAVVFDALAMIINRPLFYQANLPINEIPPHHWNDRILPLLFVLQGYHALTIGIAFDHKGGVSSLGDKYRELAERWSREQNVAFEQNWDYTFYHRGEQLFRELGKGQFPVIVDANHNRR